MNREQSLTLYKQGIEAWNDWAEGMLAERKKLEEAGAWGAEKDFLGGLRPKTEATINWFEAARADFSGDIFHADAEFSFFVFPGDAWFKPVEVKGEGGDPCERACVSRRRKNPA